MRIKNGQSAPPPPPLYYGPASAIIWPDAAIKTIFDVVWTEDDNRLDHILSLDEARTVLRQTPNEFLSNLNTTDDTLGLPTNHEQDFLSQKRNEPESEYILFYKPEHLTDPDYYIYQAELDNWVKKQNELEREGGSLEDWRNAMLPNIEKINGDILYAQRQLFPFHSCRDWTP